MEWSKKRDESLEVAGYYDKYYYENYAGGQTYSRETPIWQQFFQYFAERIIADLNPRTVLDMGCSVGILVEALRDRGVEAWGVDLSEYAIDQVRPDVREFCRVASVTEELDRTFDVIVCIEVLEHVPPSLAHRSVANLANHADVILFSSTPDDFADPSHLNVQPPEYWVSLFGRFGHFREVEYDATYVTPHAMCFRRHAGVPLEVIATYERNLTRAAAEAASVRRVNMSLVEENHKLQEELASLRLSGHRPINDRFDHALRKLQPLVAPAGTTRYRLARRMLGRNARG